MEQVGEGRGGGELGGDEDKQRHPRPPPQQQCPRCESLDTKFCYYNNYSLLQPRYFCKACKRPWTLGGTLRNVPIGGRSRRGKRSKSSSSSTINSFQSQMQPHPQPQHQLQVQPQKQLQSRPQIAIQEVVQNQSNLTMQPQLQVQLQAQPQMQLQLRQQPAIQEVVQNQPNLTMLMRHTPPTLAQSTSPYYQGSGVGGGGYLSSLVAVHSLNPSLQPFNQSLNVGGDVMASSNLGLLSGFNTTASLASQHNHHSQSRPPQFNQIGHRDREVESMRCVEQGYNIPPNMANSNVAFHSDHWPQSFVSDTGHRASDASLWSTISITSSSGNTRNNIGAGSSLMQNHLPNLPGYGYHQ